MGANRDEVEQRRWIGRRIRRRRLFLEMTQAALARALGITFQQLQKYENGKNRVPEGRLRAIAEQLEVTEDYFAVNAQSLTADAIEDFVQSADGIALVRSVAELPDAQARARLIMAVALFCDSHVRPEDGEAELLSTWLQEIVHRPVQQEKTATAAIRALKIELAQRIGKTLKARKFTQKFAARLLFTDQARISALARGDVRGSSFEKLLRYLLLLGWSADLRIARQTGERLGPIAVTARDG